MSKQDLSIRLALRLTVAVLLIVLGTCILTKVFDPLANNYWLPIVMLFAGIFILNPSSHDSTLAGLVLVGIGGFLLLREIGVITTPWLGYFLGGFCVLTGAVSIIRNATGKEVRLLQTYGKTKNDNRHTNHEGA